MKSGVKNGTVLSSIIIISIFKPLFLTTPKYTVAPSGHRHYGLPNLSFTHHHISTGFIAKRFRMEAYSFGIVCDRHQNTSSGLACKSSALDSQLHSILTSSPLHRFVCSTPYDLCYLASALSLDQLPIAFLSRSLRLPIVLLAKSTSIGTVRKLPRYYANDSSSPMLTRKAESNSTYYSDLDIARTHLLCTLFSVGIDRARHKHGNGIINLRKDSFTIKLGAVKCSFRREIRPYERYEMWTRVLSWETKWLYTITHFVRKDPKSKGSTVCATAISQCVFKSGHRTIPPEVMLRTSGLWPHEIFPRPILPVAAAHHHTLNEVTGQAGIEDSHKHQYALDTLRQSDFVDGDGWIGSQKVTNMQTGGCTSEMIENERRRGMGTVNGGDLGDLEQDFFADVDLLGRHFDL